MSTHSDFDLWLDSIDLTNYDDIYSLYRAVSDEKDCGMFECQKNGEKLFIKSSNTDDVLFLASEKAKNYFIEIIQKRFVDSEMSIDGWYEFKKAMGKED